MRIYRDGKLVLDYHPHDYCACGRRYDDTPYGEVFASPKWENNSSIEEKLYEPELCIVCYYKDELKNGRWAPKFIVNEEYS